VRRAHARLHRAERVLDGLATLAHSARVRIKALLLIVHAGLKVHLALGYTDMRKGMDRLAMLVQETLNKDPFSGHLFAFRGKKASMLKILFWDGSGLCLFSKRIDQGRFVWPVMAGYDGSITLTPWP
jgi:transposase